MLMPIIAAIGSFWVSERILKPKATALFILSCLAIYDVFISPPIPILRQSGHRGDAIVEEMDNRTTLDDTPDDNNYYQLYNQQEEDDLATSLRCYRGPLLLAVALFCAAYSLRVWRRGGCACDELLFLPGTPHEHAIIVARNHGRYCSSWSVCCSYPTPPAEAPSSRRPLLDHAALRDVYCS